MRFAERAMLLQTFGPGIVAPGLTFSEAALCLTWHLDAFHTMLWGVGTALTNGWELLAFLVRCLAPRFHCADVCHQNLPMHQDLVFSRDSQAWIGMVICLHVFRHVNNWLQWTRLYCMLVPRLYPIRMPLSGFHVAFKEGKGSIPWC